MRLAAACLFMIAFAASAQAGPIVWTVWKKDQVGQTGGSATGVVVLQSGKIHIHYRGEVGPHSCLGPGYPSWGPPSTFSGGSVGNPPGSGNQIALVGGPDTGTNTIEFSQPVTNPIIAIWSLGQRTILQRLHILRKQSITLESGGPSNEYGGKSVRVHNSVISGREGNGTVQLNGTFTKIRFTVPLEENWSAFTIGIPQ
jgi:hypothetical protein